MDYKDELEYDQKKDDSYDNKNENQDENIREVIFKISKEYSQQYQFIRDSKYQHYDIHSTVFELWKLIFEEINENEKNFIFGCQIIPISFFFFMNSALISKDSELLIILFFIEIYKKYENDCNFFFTKEFLSALIIKATTYLPETENKFIQRINTLFRMLLKSHHELFPVQFAIQQYLKSIDDIHHFEFMKTFNKLVKTEEATFEYCVPIYPHLNVIFDINNDYYQERKNFAKLAKNIISKGDEFQRYFCEVIDMHNFFDLLVNETDISISRYLFGIYTILLNQKSAELALMLYDIIDKNRIYKSIVDNFSECMKPEISDPWFDVYCVSICNFFQAIFSKFRQFFNEFDVSMIEFFFNLSSFQYKIKIEAIHCLCLICCNGPSENIPFLTEKGLIEQILAILDDFQVNPVFMLSLKSIIDYAIASNNNDIKNEIFQDSVMNLLNDNAEKSNSSEITGIYQYILKLRDENSV